MKPEKHPQNHRQYYSLYWLLKRKTINKQTEAAMKITVGTAETTNQHGSNSTYDKEKRDKNDHKSWEK